MSPVLHESVEWQNLLRDVAYLKSVGLKVEEMDRTLNGIPGDEDNIGVLGMVREIRTEQRVSATNTERWQKRIFSLVSAIGVVFGIWQALHK